MSAQTLLDKIRSGGYDTAFAALYGEAQVLADAKTGPSIFGIYVTEEYPVAE